jgi:hypothetical protein
MLEPNEVCDNPQFLDHDDNLDDAFLKTIPLTWLLLGHVSVRGHYSKKQALKMQIVACHLCLFSQV